MVKLEGFDGWLPFRDVFEVDGVQVRDRDDRLRKLFLEAPPARAVETSNRILEESARYNIGNVRRNLNLPTLALFLVHPTYAPRFAFSKRGEPTENGVRLWEIAFSEASRPTVIRTFDGKDIVSSGTFWVEPVSGRVVRIPTRCGWRDDHGHLRAPPGGARDVGARQDAGGVRIRDGQHQRHRHVLEVPAVPGVHGHSRQGALRPCLPGRRRLKGEGGSVPISVRAV